MSKHPASAVRPEADTRHPVRVYRVEPGTVVELLMLSPDYGGLFFHWTRDGGKYCHGRTCRSDWHKLEKCWRGYCAAELYDGQARKWLPVVLEITEAAEQSLRGVYNRGQVWRFSRPKAGKGKHGPVVAELRGTLEEKFVSPTWDYRPVLYHLYHETELDLSAPNPLPPRLAIEVMDRTGAKLIPPSDGNGVKC